jgi:hypothetical protein
LGEVQAEEVGWSLTPESGACLDCPPTKKLLEVVRRGLIDLSTMSHGSTSPEESSR